MKKIILILILISISTFANASTKTVICDFDRWSNEEGWHKVKGEFKLNFIVDNKTGESYMLGNNGSNKVAAFFGDSAITFVEVTGTKNVMTTTVVIPETGDIKAVHSRNIVIREDILPSQYYGTCIFK